MIIHRLENYFQKHISDKWLESGFSKQLSKLNTKKTNSADAFKKKKLGKIFSQKLHQKDIQM